MLNPQILLQMLCQQCCMYYFIKQFPGRVQTILSMWCVTQSAELRCTIGHLFATWKELQCMLNIVWCTTFQAIIVILCFHISTLHSSGVSHRDVPSTSCKIKLIRENQILKITYRRDSMHHYIGLCLSK